MVPYRRINNAEGLTTPRSTYDIGASKRVCDVNPSMSEFSMIVIPHGDIDGVFCHLLFFFLLKALLLKIEAVLHKTVLEIFRHVVESYVYEDSAYNRGYHIQPNIASK